jgi:hypothetical protein
MDDVAKQCYAIQLGLAASAGGADIIRHSLVVLADEIKSTRLLMAKSSCGALLELPEPPDPQSTLTIRPREEQVPRTTFRHEDLWDDLVIQLDLVFDDNHSLRPWYQLGRLAGNVAKSEDRDSSDLVSLCHELHARGSDPGSMLREALVVTKRADAEHILKCIEPALEVIELDRNASLGKIELHIYLNKLKKPDAIDRLIIIALLDHERDYPRQWIKQKCIENKVNSLAPTKGTEVTDSSLKRRMPKLKDAGIAESGRNGHRICIAGSH